MYKKILISAIAMSAISGTAAGAQGLFGNGYGGGLLGNGYGAGGGSFVDRLVGNGGYRYYNSAPMMSGYGYRSGCYRHHHHFHGGYGGFGGGYGGFGGGYAHHHRHW